MPEVNGVAGERLRSFIERVERLEEEKAALASDIKEIYAEAKAVGFDTKVMRQVVRLRKIDAEERQEQETLLDLYLQAVGMKPVGGTDDNSDEGVSGAGDDGEEDGFEGILPPLGAGATDEGPVDMTDEAALNAEEPDMEEPDMEEVDRELENA